MGQTSTNRTATRLGTAANLTSDSRRRRKGLTSLFDLSYPARAGSGKAPGRSHPRPGRLPGTKEADLCPLAPVARRSVGPATPRAHDSRRGTARGSPVRDPPRTRERHPRTDGKPFVAKDPVPLAHHRVRAVQSRERGGLFLSLKRLR